MGVRVQGEWPGHSHLYFLRLSAWHQTVFSSNRNDEELPGAALRKSLELNDDAALEWCVLNLLLWLHFSPVLPLKVHGNH